MTDNSSDIAGAIERLEPCPLCGSDAVFAAEQKHCTPPFPELRCVSCAECESYGPEKWTDAEAIAAWNTRPTPSGEGLVEAAKTALCVLCAVPQDSLHVNARKDVNIACEGLRHALAAHQPPSGEGGGS
jgi:hypothetical protein